MALGLIHSACTCASKARMTRLGDALLRTRICTASPPPRWSQSQPTSFACRVMAFKGTAHLDRLPAPPLLPSVWSTSALFWLFSTAVYIHRHVYMHMYTCTPTRTHISPHAHACTHTSPHAHACTHSRLTPLLCVLSAAPADAPSNLRAADVKVRTASGCLHSVYAFMPQCQFFFVIDQQQQESLVWRCLSSKCLVPSPCSWSPFR